MSSSAAFGRPVELLLVEDSPSDAGLTRAALKNAAVSINVHVVEDGENLEIIPIIVLTTSAAPEDVAQIYKLRANCYVQKPVDLPDFMSAIKALDSFWFTYATLPPTR
ncbi:MAG: hypothetical protein HYV60_08625 [Planctomycetia bacterium]|nr:hypothetical protein [Planctomycetia bacterium]